jgi:hypothetical protein
MKIRILSLLFAAVLQVVPLARVVYSTAQAVAPESTIIFRLVIGAVASLGAFDAVSGASTTITSPNAATGTLAQAFSYRITVGPRAANIYRAVPLPDGLYLEKSFILGTPTTPGVTEVKLTASDGSHSVSKWITLFILPPDGPWPPVFIEQPKDESAAPGETTTFHTSVYSQQPTTFQWLFNGEPIPDATEGDLTFANDPTVHAGLYSVIANNATGSATSAVARLYIGVPLVNSNALWKYSDIGKNMGTKWRALPFVDSTWLSGTAPFGYGWGDETTTVSPGLNPLKPNITTYFRHAFFVADSNAYPGFKLKLQSDDGAAVYLNGKEILRLNLPEKGNVSFKKVAVIAQQFPTEREWQSFSFFQPVVLTGTNIFAVEVHQAKTNGADMRFDFRFSGLLIGE